MSPFVRIALRYGSGFLVAKGFLTPEDATFLATDPDVILVAGALIGAATEAWYLLANRLGWAK